MFDKTYGQRLVLIADASSLGKSYRVYLGMLLGAAPLIFVVSWVPWVAFRWFYNGLCAGVLGALLAVMMTRQHDPAVRGQWAEEWSIASLRKVKGWLVTKNLPFDGYDVDHVAVTPSTVLAIETKYRGKVSNPEWTDRRHQRELRSAQEAARKLGSFLRSVKLHQDCSITPVLMVWGPGRPVLPDGYRCDGDVFVVEADHPELWSHLFAAPTMSTEIRQRVHSAVEDYAGQRAGHEATKQAPLRHAMWSAFRQGCRDGRSEHTDRRELARNLRRRHAQPEPTPLAPARLAPAPAPLAASSGGFFDPTGVPELLARSGLDCWVIDRWALHHRLSGGVG